MDGIAICFAPERREFSIQATAFAGQAQLELKDAGHCIEIMTGAVLPVGCNTVIPVEEIHTNDVMAKLDSAASVRHGQFIHARASDHLEGTPLLSAGDSLGMAEMAVVASAGLPTVRVSKIPNVAIIATGDELVAAGKPILAHQIRLSNGPAIETGLHLAGFTNTTLAHLVDDPAELKFRLEQLLMSHDVLVLSGGVSMGKADYVPGILDALGVQAVFHKVRQRPGKPLWYGRGPAGQVVFALPGNPQSALIGCRRHVIPALRIGMGAASPTPLQLPLAEAIEFQPYLTALMAVRIVDQTSPTALSRVPANTSGDFASLAGTAGFIELERESQQWRTGENVAFHPWRVN